MHIRTATTAQTPEELLNDLRTLVSDAELMLNDSAGAGTPATFATLRARCSAAQTKLRDLYTGTKAGITAGLKSTDDTIRAHPYESLALALGAGLLVGAVLTRRSH
jgi:ElaB/YqjD/DUF883 family membrane-anchored ribosome-binding protein